MSSYRSFFRPAIDRLDGYAPGEQPKIANLLKLNTNENPYSPAPEVLAALHDFDGRKLRRYPDAMADELCQAIAERHQVTREMVIAGNGSDDILTMLFRAFTDPERPMAMLNPSYSLYPVLAAMQEAPVIKIDLDVQHQFAMPTVETILEKAQSANLLMIARPNAPTGNLFPLAAMREIAAKFQGVLVIDEAYADFATDNCMDLVREFSNVVVSRTASKSFALAGLRFGYAVAHPEIIKGMVKLKDSYNLDMITQTLATAAVRAEYHTRELARQVIAERERLSAELTALRFEVIPSQANFVFAAPPDGDGATLFHALREKAIVVRYFPGDLTGRYLRITVGTREQNDRVLRTIQELRRAPAAGQA